MKQELLKLVAKNDLESVLNKLLASDLDDYLKKKVISLSARYNRTKSQDVLGVEPSEGTHLEYNRIAEGLLECISELPDNPYVKMENSNSQINNTSKSSSGGKLKSSLKFIIPILVGLIGYTLQDYINRPSRLILNFSDTQDFDKQIFGEGIVKIVFTNRSPIELPLEREVDFGKVEKLRCNQSIRITTIKKGYENIDTSIIYCRNNHQIYLQLLKKQTTESKSNTERKKQETTENNKCQIAGIVINPDSTPINGAYVNLWDQSTKTNELGIYDFDISLDKKELQGKIVARKGSSINHITKTICNSSTDYTIILHEN